MAETDNEVHGRQAPSRGRSRHEGQKIPVVALNAGQQLERAAARTEKFDRLRNGTAAMK
jgi:hypothetical protein